MKKNLIIFFSNCAILTNAFILPTQIQKISINKKNNVVSTINRNTNALRRCDLSSSLGIKQESSLQAFEGFDMENVAPLMVNLVLFFTIYSVLSFIIYTVARNNSMGGGGNNLFNLGKDDTNPVDAEVVDVKFSDIAGLDFVKTEINDIMEYLKNPERFTNMGAYVPRGLLLTGAPGGW